MVFAPSELIARQFLEGAKPVIAVSPRLGLSNAGGTANSLILFGLRKDDRAYALAYRYTISERCLGGTFGGCSYVNKIWERGVLLLYGQKVGHVLVFFGTGVMRVDQRIGPRRTEVDAIGLPIEIRFVNPSLKSLGFGVTLYGNINRYRDVFGAGISFAFGAF